MPISLFVLLVLVVVLILIESSIAVGRQTVMEKVRVRRK
jgi:hypothetical protein